MAERKRVELPADVAEFLAAHPGAIHSVRDVLGLPEPNPREPVSHPWTRAEDLILLENPGASSKRMSIVLGRSDHAVKTRRRDLRRQGEAPRHRFLSDDDRMAIILATTMADAIVLGAAVGVSRDAVHHLRSTPWMVAIEYVPCEHCGETLIRPASPALGGMRRFHVRCAQLRKRPARRGRNAEMSDEERHARTVRSHRRQERKQRQSLRTATEYGRRWSQEETEYLLANPDGLSHPGLAHHLGRSLYAVKAKLAKLEGRRSG